MNRDRVPLYRSFVIGANAESKLLAKQSGGMILHAISTASVPAGAFLFTLIDGETDTGTVVWRASSQQSVTDLRIFLQTGLFLVNAGATLVALNIVVLGLNG